MDIAKVEQFFQTADHSSVDEYLNKMEKAYFSEETIISDELYDHLLSIYTDRFGERQKIGHIPSHNRIDLPVPLPGLNKVVTEKELQKYVSRNDGPYVISDKIDGISGLLEILHDSTNGSTVRKLYSRGDGSIGEDISHLLSYITLPVIDANILVRGELVILNSDHETYFAGNINPRTTTGGLIRSNSTDPEGARLIQFIAYEIFFPANEELKLTPSQQFAVLNENGFQIPHIELVETLDFKYLTDLLIQRKKVVPYNIDGLVINQDQYNLNSHNKNPNYSVKFKQILHTATATVTEVQWNASKLGFLRPKVKIIPINYHGETLKSFTGKSAKFIQQNNIGPGAELLITKGGEVIPEILQVLRPATVSGLPPDDGSWKWYETGVNIILLTENDDVRISKNYEFFKQIDAKFLGKETIEKIYQAGFKTIDQILRATPEQLANIDGIGDRSAARICESIKTALESATLVDIMSASTTFGQGFGKRKIGTVLEAYPNLLLTTFTGEELYEMLIKLKGFQEKTTINFIEGYPKFIQFISESAILHQLVMKLLTEPVPVPAAKTAATTLPPLSTTATTATTATAATAVNTNLPPSLKGKKVVITGTRNAQLKKELEMAGAKIMSAVSRNTDLVINAGENLNTGKSTEAIRLGIPIISLAEFRSTYLH